MRRTLPPASAAVATMAALSTACRSIAFVPNFASNAALLGGGRTRHFAALSNKCSSRRLVADAFGSVRLPDIAGRRQYPRVIKSGVALQMSSSSAAQDTVEALAASIKAKGDEIRR